MRNVPWSGTVIMYSSLFFLAYAKRTRRGAIGDIRAVTFRMNMVVVWPAQKPHLPVPGT